MDIKILKDYKNLRTYLSDFLLLSKKNLHTLNMSKEGIYLNNNPVNLYNEVKASDILKIDITLAKSNYLPNTNNKNITKEYEDEFLLIVSKPFGIKTHPNEENENNSLVNYLIKDYLYLEPIHRLDIDTCGLVIFAKTPLIKAKLDKMLELREIKRYYSAIVKNNIIPQKIITKISRDKIEKNKMTVSNNGKEAITNILEIKKIENGYYKLLISLETGRTHQIRVHLKHIKNSIIGDPLYSKDSYKFNNMYLGAMKVGFKHPITEKNISVTSSLEKLFENINL